MVRVQKKSEAARAKIRSEQKSVPVCDGHARHHLPSVPPLFYFGSHGHKISKITNV